MNATEQDHIGAESAEEDFEKVIGEQLRLASQTMAGISNFGYPVPALCIYLEAKEASQIVTAEQPGSTLKAELVITSPVLSLIAYSQQMEREGNLVMPEQKDTMREELSLLDQMLDQVKTIVASRQEWLGPKEKPSLIVMNSHG